MNEIAIIGMAGRFPGSRNINELWENLCAGKDAISNFTDEELIRQGIAPEVINDPAYVKAGSVLEGIENFDADFFGFSPKEAEITDPQHRLLLECSWEALENAGCVPDDFSGAIGVFVGGSLSTYLLFNLLTGIGFSGPVDNIPMLIGNDKDYLATRLSYKLNLKGPSINVQTACSSSLVAVHMACQSLLNGECDAALAGGVTIRVPQAVGYFYQEGGYLSPDGRCKAFAQEANGTIFGNGLGVIVLKRMSDALAAGDRIDAVIKGSAVNNDGAAKVGFTAPSIEGQVRVISEALAMAEIPPETISYVEAHGTGTPLGDPIEISSLTQVFGAATDRQQFCAIGSIKSNIGHLESAAGVAGLIKTVLALKHKILPPSLNCQTPSQRIDFPNTPFYVNTSLQNWDASDVYGRRAAVSSFGIGGTNAHVILEEYVASPDSTSAGLTDTEKPGMFFLSAHKQEVLLELAANYREWFCQDDKTKTLFQDICYTISQRRKRHTHRLAIVAGDVAECGRKLDYFLRDEVTQGLYSGIVHQNTTDKLVFVFSGQGAQWWGMGRQLLSDEPVFRQMLEKCDRIVRDIAGWSVLKEFEADEQNSNLDGDNIEITQVALFCLQVSLAAVWNSYGLQPAAFIGHSMGEVAAAFVAGALSLNEAVKVIFTRSRLLRNTNQKGAMASIELPPEDIERELINYREHLGVAACNSPLSTVVSGEAAVLGEFLERLEERDIFYRLLRTNGVAGHSPQVESQKHQLVSVLSGLRPKPTDVPIISTVTGQMIDGKDLDADYWGRNLREPVRFAVGINQLLKTGHNIFLEISPHPILAGALKQCAEEAKVGDCLILHSLRRDDEERTFLSVAAQLTVRGYLWKEEKLFPNGGGRCIETPGYPWQRERYWIEPGSNTTTINADLIHPATASPATQPATFNGWTESSVEPGTFFSEIRLDVKTHPWLTDHIVGGEIVVPAAFYLEWICRAGAMLFPQTDLLLKDVIFSQLLILSAQKGVRLQITTKALANDSFSISISSFDPRQKGKNRWVCHVRSYLEKDNARTGVDLRLPDPKTLPDSVQLSSDRFYSKLEQRKIHYGKTFRVLERIRFNRQTALARMFNSDAETSEYVQKQSLSVFQLDGLLQTFLPLCEFSPEAGMEDDRLMLPVSLSRLTVSSGNSQTLSAVARLRKTNLSSAETGYEADLFLADENGRHLVNIEGLKVRPLETESSLAQMQAIKRLLHQVEWQEQTLRNVTASGKVLTGDGHWLILADRGGIGDQLRVKLEEQGQTCEMLRSDDWLENTPKSDLADAISNKLSGRSGNLSGVIHLWNLDLPDLQDSLQIPFKLIQRLSCDSMIALFQTLADVGKSNGDRPPRLWFVTKGGQPTGAVESDNSASAGSALSRGIARAARYEHPEYSPTICDLSLRPGRDETDKLFDEIRFNESEPEIALRLDKRYVARISRPGKNNNAILPAEGKSSVNSAIPTRSHFQTSGREPDDEFVNYKFRPDATYLISGGFGGLGLATASWMIAEGAKQILLIGRNQPNKTVLRIIEDFEKKGATVKTYISDVSDEPAIRTLLAEVSQNLPPLRGIVHAAGVLSDGLIAHIDPAQMSRVLTPKVLGAWNLHRLTLDLELDFFVLYSSVAAMIGAPGQASHAAANSFLDSLARYRSARNLPALSINWGPWQLVGKAAEASISQALNERGLESISPATAFVLLKSLIAGRINQAGVFCWDHQKWTEFYPQLKNSAFLSRLKNDPESRRNPAQSGDDLKSKLQAVPAGQRRSMLTKHIRTVAARVLGMDAARLKPDEPLQNYGLDSLRALEYRNVLEKITNSKISAVICWKYPSVEELSRYLESLINLPFESPQTDPPGIEKKHIAAPSVTDLERLSEAETVNLLREKLEALK